jgi:hypothetical protein
MNFIVKHQKGIAIFFALCAFIKPAFCFLILGIICCYVAFGAFRFMSRIQKKGIEWEGKIIGYHRSWNRNKTPLIEFTTKTGHLIQEKPYVYTTTDLSKLRTYSNIINQPVIIIYDPDDPKKFVLEKEKGFNYFSFTLATLVGLFFIGLSICWLSGYIKMD